MAQIGGYDTDEEQPQAAPPLSLQPNNQGFYVPQGAPEGFRAYPNTEQGAEYYNARQQEFEGQTDWNAIERRLQEEAKAQGVAYDSSDLAGIRRNAGYDISHQGSQGRYNDTIQQFIGNAFQNYAQRATNDPGGGSNDGAENPRALLGSGQPYPYAGGTFSDPWTSQLEGLLTGQLNKLTNAPAGSPQALLSQFLLDRFNELSKANGYTSDEQAILNTQAFEPIEQQRQASQQRAMERAAARGILPSSGLVQGEQSANDRYYDQLRTVANRDLAVNQLNRRDQQRNQALSMITGLNTQEQSVNDKALQLATLLRQLPIDAQNQALNVINQTGSPSQLLSQVTGMVTQNQMANQNSQAQMWNQIGQWVNLAFGR